MRTPVLLLFSVCALAMLVACGTAGAPSPPALELPRPSADLMAARKGDTVTISWTPARKTADGRNVRFSKLGPVVICRGINLFPMANCPEVAGKVAPEPLPVAAKGAKHAPSPDRMSFTDVIPPELQQKYPTGSVTYAVSATNRFDRSAGFSNQVTVPLAPTIPPPSTVSVEVTAEGISANFRCAGEPAANPALRFQCRLYRQEQGSGASVMVGAISPGASDCAHAPGGAGLCRMVDHGFEWEKTYRYWVAVVTEVREHDTKVAEVEGADSRSAVIWAHDIFPPAVPGNLEAVASGVGQKPFIDLAWTPGTEADLAGYNLYRQEPGTGQWIKINAKLISTPAYRDEDISPKRTYTYVVTAVDVRGQESGRSEPSSEQVP